jgi:hypothetical protein
MAAVMAGSPPRSSSSGSVPDYIGDDLGHALSTPERLRPDSAWCATAYYVPHQHPFDTGHTSGYWWDMLVLHEGSVIRVLIVGFGTALQVSGCQCLDTAAAV